MALEHVRGIVHPSLRRLPDAALAETLEAYGVDAEAMESWFKDIGKIAAKVAPSVLPIAGNVLGGVIGGPIGAQLGGQLGSFAGGAITSATSPKGAAPVGGNVPRAPGPLAGAVPTGGSPAAGQLLQTIARPEVMRAVASMAMGPAGKPSIPVGQTDVPVSAFGNLLSVLTSRAEAEYAEAQALSRESVPEYLRSYDGEAIGDPAVGEQRASALLCVLSREAEREALEAASEFESESETESESESEGMGRWQEAQDNAELLALEYEIAAMEAYD